MQDAGFNVGFYKYPKPPALAGSHKPDIAAIKKSDIGWNMKQKGHAQHVPVKGNGFVQVMHVDGDLTNL